MELNILLIVIAALAIAGITLILISRPRRQELPDYSDIFNSISREIGQIKGRLNYIQGKADSAVILAKTSEQLADRAFTMASSATVGHAILQRSLYCRPKSLTNEQLLKDEVAKNKLGDLFGRDEVEFLKPLLSDDEIELYEEAQRQARKSKSKSNGTGV